MLSGSSADASPNPGKSGAFMRGSGGERARFRSKHAASNSPHAADADAHNARARSSTATSSRLPASSSTAAAPNAAAATPPPPPPLPPPLPHAMPPTHFIAMAVLLVLSIGLSNLSLLHLSYPVKVVIKSSKLLPVMILGKHKEITFFVDFNFFVKDY